MTLKKSKKSEKSRFAFVFGTRPEIIKLAKLINLFDEGGMDFLLIHTGQHYSNNLSSNFIKELGITHEIINLNIVDANPVGQVSKMMLDISSVLLKNKVELVIVQGDTNSALAGCLCAVKLNILVAHVEAGIRSFFRGMPEEVNRVLIDQVSDFLFAPTEIAVKNLLGEGRPLDKIFLVGNTIIENVRDNMSVADLSSNILDELNIKKDEYIVFTAHRQENVDDYDRFNSLIVALKRIESVVVYPIHPRSLKKLQEFGLSEKLKVMENVMIIGPLSYFDFIKLCKNAKFLITDSGGIQEEATIFKKYVLVTRDNTERPEILGVFGELVGCDSDKIINAMNRIDDSLLKGLEDLESPFGDGLASKRIVEILKKL